MRGSRLVVSIANLDSGDAIDPSGFRLRLNGHRFDNLVPEPTEAGNISFDLTALRGDKAGWLELVGQPPLVGSRTVRVDVATSGLDLATMSGEPCVVQFRVFSPVRLAIGAVFVGLLWLVILGLGVSTNMLRDPAPVAGGKAKPFSLARCQMAFWFLLVTTAFIGIALVTGNTNDIITDQSLALLGVSGGTAIGAAAIDGVKVSGGETGAAPFHQTFWEDLLTDDSGLVFHRVKIYVFTVKIKKKCLWSAWEKLTMPDFDVNLLALMGISSGLYLGFKWPEQQSSSKSSMVASGGVPT